MINRVLEIRISLFFFVFFIFLFIYLFIFWLHWVCVAACGLSLAAVSGSSLGCGVRASHAVDSLVGRGL